MGREISRCVISRIWEIHENKSVYQAGIRSPLIRCLFCVYGTEGKHASCAAPPRRGEQGERPPYWICSFVGRGK